MTLAIKHALLNRDVSHLTFPDEIQELPVENNEQPQTPQGRSGTPIASWFMNEADLLLVIGASFSKHTGITPKIKTIQIDFDPLALSKFHKIDVPVWGEISVTVDMLRSAMRNAGNKVDRRTEIAERKTIWQQEKQKRLQEDRGKGVSSIAVFDALSRLAPPNAVVCVDVGNNAYSLGRYFESKNHTFLMSGYLGSIGFAFPAAMGAWAAVGNTQPVIAVAGDGGFCQYLAELTTAVKYNMPIKALILNNQELGKISKEQRAGEFEVWATSLSNPAFAEYAQGCGAFGIKVTQASALPLAIEKLMEHPGPGLVEVMTDANLI